MGSLLDAPIRTVWSCWATAMAMTPIVYLFSMGPVWAIVGMTCGYEGVLFEWVLAFYQPAIWLADESGADQLLRRYLLWWTTH